MLIGGIVDSIVFGQRGFAVYPGKTRNGAAWDEFKAAHTGQYLCLESEADEARGAANAVLSDVAAHRLLDGLEYQVTAQWDAFGLPCAAGIPGERGGFDAVGEGRLVDLKVTSSTQPEELSKHALRMHWHCQLAWYLEGLRVIGLRPVHEAYIIAVEVSPPHPVTCMRIPPEVLLMGHKLLVQWTDQHRRCEYAGVWPGYVQEPIDLELPAWMQGVELDGLG
jgi:hypothetical protein